jgi:hypothetical protein
MGSNFGRETYYRDWDVGWMTPVQFLAGAIKGHFLFTTASAPIPEPPHPPIQWVPGIKSLRFKWPGRKVDHSTFSAEIKNAWSCTFTHPYVFMPWYFN